MRAAALLQLSFALGCATTASATDLFSSQISIAGITPGGKTTLHQVVDKLGPSDTWHSGDAGESEYKICYRVSTEGKTKFLIFGSSGEMANPKGQVTSIKIIEADSISEYSTHCKRPGVNTIRLASSLGLRLGMSKPELSKAMGPGKLTESGAVEYSSCTNRYMKTGTTEFRRWVGKEGCFENRDRPYFNDCRSVTVLFSDGAAVQIEVAGGQSVC